MQVEGSSAREIPVEPWQHLVSRRHAWRKQLYVKGRNLTARQLVGSIKANQLDEEKAAANFNLPSEAIREALRYVDQNKELLEEETQIERQMLNQGGVARGRLARHFLGIKAPYLSLIVVQSLLRFSSK
jgi:uncharacterized protein (DUF433 family)